MTGVMHGTVGKRYRNFVFHVIVICNIRFARICRSHMRKRSRFYEQLICRRSLARLKGLRLVCTPKSVAGKIVRNVFLRFVCFAVVCRIAETRLYRQRRIDRNGIDVCVIGVVEIKQQCVICRFGANMTRVYRICNLGHGQKYLRLHFAAVCYIRFAGAVRSYVRKRSELYTQFVRACRNPSSTKSERFICARLLCRARRHGNCQRCQRKQ